METLYVFESALDLAVFQAIDPVTPALTVDEPETESLRIVESLVEHQAAEWLSLVRLLRWGRILSHDDVDFVDAEIGNPTLSRLLRAFAGHEDSAARLAALVERAREGEGFQAERVVFIRSHPPSVLFRELAEASGAEYLAFDELPGPSGTREPLVVGGSRASRLDFIVDRLGERAAIQAEVSPASRMFLEAAVARNGANVLWLPARPVPRWIDRPVLIAIEEKEPVAPLLSYSEMGKLAAMGVGVLAEPFRPSLAPWLHETVIACPEGKLPALTAGRARPVSAFRPEKGRVPATHSASSLETYAACPARYAYRYRDGIEGPVQGEEAIPLILGSATHQALEAAFRETAKTPERTRLTAHFQGALAGQSLSPLVRRAVELSFETFADRVAPLEEELLAMFGRLSRRHFETSFSIVVEGVTLRGRVDRVDRLPTGEPLILDYKTGKVDFTPEQIGKGTAFQAFCYLLAHESAAGVLYYGLKDNEVRRGIFLEDRVPKEAKKKLTRGHVLAADKWAELKAQGTAHIQRIAQAIAREQFEPTPSRAACEFCEYGGICRARFGGDDVD